MFAVERLHAKMLVVPGRLITIGSQNLTRGGTRKREATAVLTDAKAITLVEREIGDWCAAAKRITVEMLRDMALAVAPLRKRYRDLMRAMKIAGAEVRAAAERREAATSAMQQKRRREHAYAARLRAARSTLRLVSTAVAGAVKMRSTFRLEAPYNRTFTRWRLGKREVVLQRRQRYLCMRANGAIGWARVGRTRISFVSRSIIFTDEIRVGGRSLWIEADCPSDNEALLSHNVEIKFYGERETTNLLAEVPFQFTLTRLVMVDARYAPWSGDGHELSWVRAHRRGLEDVVLKLLVKPFVYKAALYGGQADEFFGPPGSRCELRVARVGTRLILLADDL